MSYLERLKAHLAGKTPTSPTDKTDKSPSVSLVSNQGEGISTARPPSVSFVGSQGGRSWRGDADGCTVIDIAAHLTRAQRIADQNNIEAARQGHTDRWCRCGDYASRAWPIKGREIWLCPKCEKERRQ